MKSGFVGEEKVFSSSIWIYFIFQKATILSLSLEAEMIRGN